MWSVSTIAGYGRVLCLAYSIADSVGHNGVGCVEIRVFVLKDLV